MLRFSVPGSMLLIVLFLPLAQSTAADEAELNQAIAQHRMGTLTVTAPPGAPVRVEQLRHEFWFGAALSSGFFSPRANAEQAAKYEMQMLVYALAVERILKSPPVELALSAMYPAAVLSLPIVLKSSALSPRAVL